MSKDANKPTNTKKPTPKEDTPVKAADTRASKTAANNPQATDKGNKLPLLIAAIALIAALGAMTGGYFLVLQLNDLQTSIQETSRLENTLKQNNKTQNAQIAELRSALKSQKDQLPVYLKQQSRPLVERLNALEKDQGKKISDNNLLNDVEWLLTRATIHLQLNHDAAYAIAALKHADKMIKASNQKGLDGLRSKIANDLTALRAAPKVDATAINGTLNRLILMAEQLPLRPFANSTNKNQTSTQTTISPPANSWQGFFNDIWQKLKGLISIKHNEGVVAERLTDEQAVILKQSLQLKLESARIALLQLNPRIFQPSLTDAEGWLARYFDLTDEGVINARQILGEMQQINIAPQLPTQLTSLLALSEAEAKNVATKPAPKIQTPDREQTPSNTSPTTTQPGSEQGSDNTKTLDANKQNAGAQDENARNKEPENNGDNTP